MKKAIDISTSPYTKLCRLISSLLLLSWVGCSNEDLPDPSVPGSNKEPVVLIFNASPALMTRTVLTSPDNLQHVLQVQLYIFDGATDNARCVASENINWQYATGADNGLSTKEQTYKVVYEGFQASKVYTFLAIGLDDTSGATYGLPNAIQANPTSGTLLKDANALLAAGKGRTDIAGSELFAGFSQLNEYLERRYRTRRSIPSCSWCYRLFQEHPHSNRGRRRKRLTYRIIYDTEQKRPFDQTRFK